MMPFTAFGQAVASDVSHQRNIYEFANATEETVTLPVDKGSDEGDERLMMMRGMTANNFDPVRYSGRWFEVASLKRGFAGQGQEDCHCTQIYSRTPYPGPEFIEKYKSYLANFGFNASKITGTPQDCEQMTDTRLSAVMSMPGTQQASTNEFPDLELKKSVQFDPFTSVFNTLKKSV
ncbi:unnamed protein product [Malus baccata var. baccata]